MHTDCIYCYADRKNPCTQKALSVEQIKIIRDAKSIQLPELDINGGEVLMHPHFKEIALDGYAWWNGIWLGKPIVLPKFTNSLEDEINPDEFTLLQYKNIKSIRIGPAGFFTL